MFISTDIPAGNGVVVDQDGDRITLRSDLRGNAAWWFYWHVALRRASGRTVEICFRDRPGFGPAGYAESRDQGRTWAWRPAVDAHRAIISVGDCDDLRLSMTMPYVRADLDAALTGIPGLTVAELCRSPAGRHVPILFAGPEPSRARAQLVLTARHHCCETMASFVLDGCLQALLTDPACVGIREEVAVIVMPFADADGVEEGDQGKMRAPFDHNRGYDSDRHVETASLRRLVDGPDRVHLPTWSIDLHCPYLLGGNNEEIFLVGSGDPQNAKAQTRFAGVLAEFTEADFGFRATDIFRHGVGWNSSPVAERKSCGAWFALRPACALSATLEIPYGKCRGEPLTAESSRRFGAFLARALARSVAERGVEAGLRSRG